MKSTLTIPSTRMLRWVAFFSLVSAGTFACADGNDRPPPLKSSGTSSTTFEGGDGDGDSSSGDGDSSSGDGDSSSGDGDSSSGDGDSSSGDGDGDGGQAAAPQVQVLSPERDAVVGRAVSVTCLVEASEEDDSAPVDVTSIMGVLRDENDEIVDSNPVSSSGKDSEYVAELSFDSLESGIYSVGCIAESAEEQPVEGSDFVDVILDLGPNIVVLKPSAGGFLSGAGVHSFEFQITPDEVFDDDDEAAISGVPTLVIDGVEFELLPKPNEDDVYWLDELSFDLDEFDILPEGATSFLVKAENERNVEARLDYVMTLDSTVPQVTVVSPAASTIVGKNGTFVFEITDEGSGVDWSTFVAKFGEYSLPYDADSDRWSLSGSTLTLSFPTAEVTSGDAQQIQLHVQSEVRDLVGNKHEAETARIFFLDQRSPVISLDPPLVRVRRQENDKIECSHAFDPVGPAAIADGASSGNLARFRAFALDRTNSTAGQEIYHYSGVDSSSLLLHVRNADVPLVIDRNDDGICDDVITNDEVGVVPLLAVEPTGSAFFGDGTADSSGPSMIDRCGYADPPAADPPNYLCSGNSSDMYYAVPQSFGSRNIPAVYAPLVSAGVTCSGDQVEVSNVIAGASDTWVCVAAVGYDSAGNRAVSAPLSICLGACDGEAPSCVSECTPAALTESERIIDLY